MDAFGAVALAFRRSVCWRLRSAKPAHFGLQPQRFVPWQVPHSRGGREAPNSVAFALLPEAPGAFSCVWR